MITLKTYGCLGTELWKFTNVYRGLIFRDRVKNSHRCMCQKIRKSLFIVSDNVCVECRRFLLQCLWIYILIHVVCWKFSLNKEEWAALPQSEKNKWQDFTTQGRFLAAVDASLGICLVSHVSYLTFTYHFLQNFPNLRPILAERFAMGCRFYSCSFVYHFMRNLLCIFLKIMLFLRNLSCLFIASVLMITTLEWPCVTLHVFFHSRRFLFRPDTVRKHHRNRLKADWPGGKLFSFGQTFYL